MDSFENPSKNQEINLDISLPDSLSKYAFLLEAFKENTVFYTM